VLDQKSANFALLLSLSQLASWADGVFGEAYIQPVDFTIMTKEKGARQVVQLARWP
jgi:hypothetical protein